MTLSVFHPRVCLSRPSAWCFAVAAVLAAVASSAVAQMPSFGMADAPEPVTASVAVMSPEVAAGNPTAIAVVIEIAEPYHINPDEARSGPPWFEGQYPTTLRVVSSPDDARLGRVQFPEPHGYEVSYAEQEILVYDGQVVLYLPVLIDAEAAPGPRAFQLELEYQACDPQVCLMPAFIDLEASFDVIAPGTAASAGTAEDTVALFADFDPAGWSEVGEDAGTPGPDASEQNESQSESITPSEAEPATLAKLLSTLAIAVAAGFLLNFTPCVLPVVPLKVMSLAKHGETGGGRGRTVYLAVLMAAGIVGFWLVIAGALVLLKQFEQVNQLFQYASVNLVVGGVIAVLAVSMLGMFTINLPRVVYQINPTGDTALGSLGFGVMTAVLATPCAGPLMGGAVAWAATQGAGTTLATFTALGLGMALPYLVLTLFPGLVNKMPRAGAGSELLKQTMGVLMLAAAAFFVGTGIVALTSDGTAANSRVHWWAVGGFIVAAGLWLIVRGVAKVCQTHRGRGITGVTGVLLIAAGGWVGFELTRPDAAVAGTGEAQTGIPWVYYTPERLAEQRAAGRTVVLDFTADWCLNCKALEKTVLENERVASRLREDGVVPMKVDITSSRNVAGTDLLKAMGRVTIPLLVVLDGGGDEVFKADFYTVDQVVDALDRAQGGAVADADG
ncbi:MAG: cytochrome c biogenesis protein CcdA [Planctomycetota bacterium]